MATDIERAWHTFAYHPNALSRRFYAAHLMAYNVDQRIQNLRDRGQWPPQIVVAERWPEFGALLDVVDVPAERYTMRLADAGTLALL